MAEKSRSLNFILLICALIGAAWFYGCSGGASSDPIPVPIMQISGTVYSQDNLGNMAYDSNLLPDIRAQFAAPGVTVHLASDETKQTVTDKDGKFSLIGVQPGTYQIVARFKVSDSLTYKVISAPISVSEQKAEVSVPQLDLKKATARVYGVVRKADGSVFPNARMTLWGETFYALSDGTFKSPPMYDNAQDTIFIDNPGYQKAELSVKFADNAPYIDQMVVTNAATNRAPSASLSATRYTVDKLYEVNLTGLGSDPDDNIATYTWSKTSGSFTADVSNPLKRTWFAPNSDTLATLTFTVVDTDGLKSASSVMITVGKGQVVPNNPPVVNPIVITPTDISGARYYELSVIATDTDKDVLAYTWSTSSSAGKPGSLQSTNTAKVIWISPDVTTQTEVVIKVIVNDRKEGGIVERTLTLPVAATQPNRAPQISGIQISATPIYGYTEYTLTANATDPDNDPITYLWTASGTIIDPQRKETVWKTPVAIATGTYDVSIRVTDSKGGSSTYKTTYEIRPTDIRPPVVNITSPAENHVYLAGKPLTLSGEATASGGVAINAARFTWYEREDAGAYALLKSGVSGLSKTYNRPGTFTVKLEAYDSLNVVGEDTVTFRINATPTVSITAPVVSSIAQLGANVTFSATGADIEDTTLSDMYYTWTFPSPVGTKFGANQITDQLPAGTQTVSVYVRDSLTATSTTASRQIFINPPPQITDIQPASGSVFLQGATVAFSTTVSDTEGVLFAGNVNWYRGTTTLIGTGLTLNKADLPAGWNTITLRASDTMGGLTATTTSVFINTAPTMKIDLPVNLSSIGLNQPFKFKGSGTDTAGAIDPALFVWEDYSFQTGLKKVVTVPFGVTPNEFDFTGYVSQTDFGSHTIYLTGTDQQGANGSTSIEIFVNSPPQIAITSPASGTRHDTDTNLTFNATLKEDDPTDQLSVRWYDGAAPTTNLHTQTGLTVDETTKERNISFTTNLLASGPHTIFCEVADMHGLKSVASVGVFINRLPIISSGKITLAPDAEVISYATAPSNIPVFLSTEPESNLQLSIDDFDYELDGSISAYDPKLIEWYINGKFFANGSTCIDSFDVGYNEVTVKIYDNFSPQFIDQASNSYQTSFYVWHSTSQPVPAGSIFMHGVDTTLYFGVNAPAACVRAYTYISGGFPSIKELDEPDNLFDLGNASVTFSLTKCNTMTSEKKVIALGQVGATDYFVHFDDPATPATHTFAGMQNAISMAFSEDKTMGYLTNSNNELIRFSPLAWNLVDGVAPLTTVDIPFDGLSRVRYAPFLPAYGSRVCVADTNNNRIVRFMKDSLAEAIIVNASSPIDIAFTQNRIVTLSNVDSKVSVHQIPSIDPDAKNLHLMDFGKAGTGTGEFNNPIAIYIHEGDLFVLESNRVQIIRSGETDWLK